MPTKRALTSLLIFPAVLAAQNFRFGAFGDMPYNAELAIRFERLIEDLNHQKMAFVINVGDLRAGDENCGDSDLEMRLNRLAKIKLPMAFTPGDNDWTDCHRKNSGSFDPLERLQLLRKKLFSPDRPIGRPVAGVRRQNDSYPENAIWSRQNIVFATIHVIGSNNNLGRNADNDAEFRARNSANLAWLKETFAAARKANAAGVVLTIHANMTFDRPVSQARDGFSDFIEQLEVETVAFDKPVLLIHGDHHTFRVDKPLKAKASGLRIENFTRLEVFGSQDIHWVRIDVSPQNPELFAIHPVLVPGNRVSRLRKP
jgi:hypothetical protein